MSQAFSLYNELTVRQTWSYTPVCFISWRNSARVAEMSVLSSTTSKMYCRAIARHSPAAIAGGAVIHRPEMLILMNDCASIRW